MYKNMPLPAIIIMIIKIARLSTFPRRMGQTATFHVASETLDIIFLDISLPRDLISLSICIAQQFVLSMDDVPISIPSH